MTIIAYTALHYGADYLGESIRSVIDHVDEYYVLYSAQGSHGHRTDRPCPDSKETLVDIAYRAAGAKLRWYDGVWPYEGAQRETIHEIAPHADLILVLDADEVWGEGLPRKAIDAGLSGAARTWRVPIIHYWRSFYRAVLRDPAFPVRVINPHVSGGEATLDTHWYTIDPKDTRLGDMWWTQLFINHFGYAQRSEIVEYKQHTHGHKGEWRKDDWFNTKFMANAQTDCHPVGSQYWNPEQVQPLLHMPVWMQRHPYYGLEVIP